MIFGDSFIINVLLSFAQFEREVTGERIRDKIAASKKKGMWMGGVVPIGYDVKERKLVINPAEAETVRRIFKRYLELKNVRYLCADLKQNGVVTKTLPNRANTGGIRRRGCEMKLIVRGNSAADSHYDSTLVKSIARAHVWFQELLSAKAGSLLEIAKQHNVSESYVKKIMPLAFLSPQVVMAVMNGNQRPYLCKQSLIRRIKIPLAWHAQIQLLK